MDENSRLWKDSLGLFPGGVNSPVRSFKTIGRSPIFIRRGKGASIYDFNNRRYIDYCMSWGALILGHASCIISAVIKRQLELGTSFGTCTKNEVILGKLIKDSFPSIERMRLVSSGTEAVMTAIRLARGFTKRNYIVKFDGCYHGHSDSLLVKAGSGVSTLNLSSSEGVPSDLVNKTISLPFNDIGKLRKVCAKFGKKIAGIIIEPVPANMGLTLPQEGFLEEMRLAADKIGAVLIFDEVISGFRVHFGGVGDIYKVKPDLTTLGKIIGAGLPIGLVGGRKDIMNRLAPIGEVYQAGTLSGNPLATAAGIAVLTHLSKNKNIYEELNRKTAILAACLKQIGKRYKVGLQVNHLGSMFSMHFSNHPIKDYESSRLQDVKRFRLFYRALLKRGVYLSPSGFETNFLSTEHKFKDIEHTLDAVKKYLFTLD
jgi:glutamate-1-semialdehyde 2,1-aminomutase